MEGGMKSGGDTSPKCDQQFIMNHQETQPKLECVDWCDASVL